VNLLILSKKKIGKVKLKPVLSLKSRIVQIKDLVIGEKVGYNGTFKAIKPMKIGLLKLLIRMIMSL